MAPLSSPEKLFEALSHLSRTIDDRAEGKESTQPSYTTKLLADGPVKCAKKLGEEAVETALAIAAGTREETADETADLFYHLFVALRAKGVDLDAVGAALAKRQGISGIVEKANRPSD